MQIIQIVAATVSGGGGYGDYAALFALDDAGGVWERFGYAPFNRPDDPKGWRRLPDPAPPAEG